MADQENSKRHKGRPKKIFDPKAYDHVREDILAARVTCISELLDMGIVSAKQLATDSGIVYKRMQAIKARPGEVMAYDLQAIAQVLKLTEEQVLKLFLNEMAKQAK